MEEKNSYILRVLISIDQLGSTIADGHPDVMVSARTGYFANKKKTRLRPWWKCMEAIIDFAFKPVDGPNHCLNAYSENEDGKHRKGSDIAKALLNILIILTCIPIYGITSGWVMFCPSSGYQNQRFRQR